MSKRVIDTPLGASFKNGLTPVEQVIADTQARHESRTTLILPTVADLNLRWVEPGRELPRGGYMGTIDGKDLPLGDTGMRTACKLIQSKPRYFEQFADPNAFPQSLRNVIDNPSRSGPGGIMVRTGLSSNGINDEIAAILDPDYKVRDANEQVSDLATMLDENIGDVRGIDIVEQGYGDKTSYRFVIGDNIMTGMEESKGQFMMFVATMSELGLMSDQTTLGVYREVCTNGAMRLDNRELLSEWNHRDGLEKYLSGSVETIRHLGMFSGQWGETFNKLLDVKLPVAAEDLLGELKDSRLIAAKHYDAAERLAITGPIDTQYDFFNLLTRAAQDLPSVQAREQAETSALRLFTEPGGLMEQVRVGNAMRNSKRSAPMRR